MKRLLALLLLSCAGLEAQTATPINENNLPSTSTLSDNDSVRVIQNGASKKTPASVVRSIRAAQINDASGVGRNWVTTATPGAISFPRINADGHDQLSRCQCVSSRQSAREQHQSASAK